MTFECAVRVEGQRCRNQDEGDATYLGSLTFCAYHQHAFEEIALSRQLVDEITSARVKRGPLGELFEQFSKVDPRAPRTRRDMRDEAAVYFLHCGDFIKIGYSSSPHMRLRQIQASDGTLHPEGMDPSGAVLLKTAPGGYRHEQELHARFSSLRHTGEWFRADADLTDFINSIESVPS